MMEVNKNIAVATLEWLEVLIDSNELTLDEKAEVQTLINFWRMYSSFTSEN